jgi:hypothetical protein
MRKSLWLLLFFSCTFCAEMSAYTDKPVLVNMNVARQSDTMGFNMPHELLELFHRLINDPA